MAKLKQIRSYQDALNALGAKDSIHLGHNTRLVRHATGQTSDGPAVIYHRTAVVIFNSDDTFTLNSGGWATTTTAERIRKYAPVYVSASQPRRNTRGASKLYIYLDGQRLPFIDGITVDAAGLPVENAFYRRFEILAIDVWGNARDGFEINGQIRTGVFFWSTPETTDADALKALRGALGHKKDARGYSDPYQSEGMFCFHRNADDKPAYYALQTDAE